MKIFVLVERQGDCEDTILTVLGVFDTYDKAQERLEECEVEYQWEYSIEELTLNDW